jgi:D-xylose transport system permease protein
MTATTTTPPEAPPAGQRVGLGESLSRYRNKIRTGDVGSLPAVLGLVVLTVLFSVLRPHTFTTAGNFANLINQGSAVMTISMGLIFVLLLGEIDLSAGFAAGTSGAIMGVTLTNHGWPWWGGILACMFSGVAIGLTIGSIVTRLGIPSFVVTLAGFLALQGVQLAIIGAGGTITINNSQIIAINNNNLPVWAGWVFFILASGGYAAFGYWRIVQRRRTGLSTVSLQVWALKSLAVIIVLGAATAYLSKQRALNKAASIKGVPDVVILLLFLLLALTFLLIRTPFGRHVYAIGGNTEAARRAGINVIAVKTACFAICSSMAAVAGILYASRNNSISPTTGGGEDLLLAVGAAVIGGCSLFGGKGRVLDAVIGGLVVAVITNGMLLLNLADSYVEIFTGLVLLVAASVDALSRRRAAASGA